MRTKQELKANDINFESLAPYMQIKYAQENDQVDTKGEIEEFGQEGIFISKLGSGQQKRPKTFGLLQNALTKGVSNELTQ